MDLEADHDEFDHQVFATACKTRPGRTVVIEEGNPDGWIATDLTVEVTR